MLEVSQHEGVKAMRNDFYFGWLSGGPRLYLAFTARWLHDT